MISYRTGDATEPDKRPAIIAHLCNNRGGFGRGFALAVANKWPHVRNQYRAPGKWPLGTTQLVHVGPSLFVANMIAQDGIQTYASRGKCLVSFPHLEKCLEEVALHAKMHSAQIWMPRIGMGLAGCTDWDVVETLIKKSLKNLEVVVCNLPTGEGST